MVPKDYQSYLKDVTTTGEAGIEGNVTGWYYEEDYPGMDILMYIKNASFNMPDHQKKLRKYRSTAELSKLRETLTFWK